jgi:mannose/fructose-specific phosphotransferase system component IIA
MSEPVRGLVVAHSSLAAGLTAAVRQIAGVEVEVLQPLTNEGKGPDGLVAAIREAVGEAPVILFTDLSSGSCALAARRVAMERPCTGVVFGANLPVLLDFVFHRDLPLTDLVERLIEKGRTGINGVCTESAADVDRAVSR